LPEIRIIRRLVDGSLSLILVKKSKRSLVIEQNFLGAMVTWLVQMLCTERICQVD